MSNSVTVSTIVAVKDFLDNIKNTMLEAVDNGDIETVLNSGDLTIVRANSTAARALAKGVLESVFTDEDVLALVDSKINALTSDVEFLSETLVEVVDTLEVEEEEEGTEDEDEDSDEDVFDDENFEDEDLEDAEEEEEENELQPA